MNDRKTFWGWVSDNPMTALMALVLFVGMVAVICGYKEGLTSILTGFFGWQKGDDVNNKRRLAEIGKQADEQFSRVGALAQDMKDQQIEHDEEVKQNVENAKADCDEMDTDELVDIGNAMLAEHGALRGKA